MLAPQLERDWGLSADRVADLICGRSSTKLDGLLSSIINGPIDADKMDYLERDSRHLGVPYGTYIDKGRFFAALTIDENAAHIALSDKGRIAAESFVFSRYAMTSEVYWHHAVRAANAMVMEAVRLLLLDGAIDSEQLVHLLLTSDDSELLVRLGKLGKGMKSGELIRGVQERKLYKRLATYSSVFKETDKRDVQQDIAAMETWALEELQTKLTRVVASEAGISMDHAESAVIIDVPPPNKDVQADLTIFYPHAPDGDISFYKLSELSELVEGLGTDFQRSLKKVRVFCRADIVSLLQSKGRAAEVKAAMVDVVLKRPQRQPV